MSVPERARPVLAPAVRTTPFITDDETSIADAMHSSSDAAHADLGKPGGLQQVFAALANSDRIAIVEVLAEMAAIHPRGVPISLVADRTELTRFSASRHLRILVEAGVVDVERERQSALHRLNADGLLGAEDWVVAVAQRVEAVSADDGDAADAWGL